MTDKKPNPKSNVTEPKEPAENTSKVSNASPVQNPDNGDYTPVDFKVVDYTGKTDKDIEKEHQDGLMEQLNRTSDEK